MNKSATPPDLPLRFFRWYCHPDLAKSIEGDLIELYAERLQRVGRLRATIRLLWDVMLLFRPGIVRSFQNQSSPNQLSMFRNYFKIGWRNLLKQRSYSIINIGGLTLGMSVSMVIGLWVYDEVTFNTYHKNYDSIAKVYRHNTFP
ncbi:MAG: permease prefix domain 2-containing transporter, partial [Cyclobacteriaceae bacterium]